LKTVPWPAVRWAGITIQLEERLSGPRDLDCAERIVSTHIVRDILEDKLQKLRNAPIPNSFRRISGNRMVGRSMDIAKAQQSDRSKMFQVPAVAFSETGYPNFDLQMSALDKMAQTLNPRVIWPNN